MGYRSGVVIDLEFDFDGSIENRSTSELISMLKSSFRDADFAKVESILVEREEERKLELESTMQANDWLKDKLEESGMQKLKAENERNELIERERKAGSLIEFWKKKYEGLESRIRQLDADIMLLASADSHARASSQNGNNVVEETPAPAAPDQGQGNANANADFIFFQFLFRGYYSILSLLVILSFWIDDVASL